MCCCTFVSHKFVAVEQLLLICFWTDLVKEDVALLRCTCDTQSKFSVSLKPMFCSGGGDNTDFTNTWNAPSDDICFGSSLKHFLTHEPTRCASSVCLVNQSNVSWVPAQRFHSALSSCRTMSKDRFEGDINFCSECGSILPLPGAGNVVTCYSCKHKVDITGLYDAGSLFGIRHKGFGVSRVTGTKDNQRQK